MDKEFIFDPKILIRPPYLRCPKCGENGCFGVLSIHSQHYTRRCKECWHDESYALPELNKKIIYLDQFVISNMMKSIHPSEKGKSPHDEYFKKLFLKLEYLAKAHIVVCPSSSIHYDESVVSKKYENIKAMYNHLSFETSYMPASTINRFHFVSAFEKYLNDVEDILIDINVVCHGYNEWKERYRIEIVSNSEASDRKQIEEVKPKIKEALLPVFEYWKTLQPFRFEEVYIKELLEGADNYISRYLAFQNELLKPRFGLEFDMDKCKPDEGIILVHQMLDVLKTNGDSKDFDSDIKIIKDFFNSDMLLEIPNHRIECLMWAAIARKVSFGQKKLGTSIVNDIKVISSYMPYSDAIFIDKECHDLLNDSDVKKRLNCSTRVFSLRNKEDFLKYLDDMIEKVSKEHISLIEDVYGEHWMKPYTLMYDLDSK